MGSFSGYSCFLQTDHTVAVNVSVNGPESTTPLPVTAATAERLINKLDNFSFKILFETLNLCESDRR